MADHGLAEVEAFDFEALVGEHVGEGSGSATGVEDGFGLLALHGEEEEVVRGPHAVGHGLHEVVVEFGDLGEAGDLGVGHAPLLYFRRHVWMRTGASAFQGEVLLREFVELFFGAFNCFLRPKEHQTDAEPQEH